MNTTTKEFSLQQRDKTVNWHPYTQMKTADDAIPIVKGKGIYLYDTEGKKYLDVAFLRRKKISSPFYVRHKLIYRSVDVVS